MPTPSEQKALGFLAAIALLSAGVRVLRAGPADTPSAAEQQALARQATAVDSASSASRSAKSRKSRSVRLVAPKGCDNVPNVVGGVASVPAPCTSTGRRRSAGRQEPEPAPLSSMGFPPPAPRIDMGGPPPATLFAPERGRGRANAPPTAATPLDLDVATIAELDRLPRVGPALAKRIVANRDSLGPFGSIEGLRRVKGVGAATAAGLAPLVTFSGRRAPRSE